MIRVEVVADPSELAEAAARRALADIEAAIDAHDECTWVLTGGGTPLAAYSRLAAHDLRDTIEWGRLRVAIGDERCVPPGDPESNWHQAAEALLDHVPLPEERRLRLPAELGPKRAADEYEAVLRRLPTRAVASGAEVPRLDLVWLGVGPDGHCLSLFPGRPEVDVADRLVVAVRDAPKPPPDRVSLTLTALTGAERLVVLASGAGKADAVARARAGDQRLPITRAVTTVERAGGTVSWLLDHEAAGAA
jgi:6-phosphogluconolactonase